MMQKDRLSHLKRRIQPMPDFVRRSLTRHNLMEAYLSRPPYQQNDYLSWINRAKLKTTREKRLNVMLDELNKGEGYMKLPWRPAKKKEESDD